MSSGHLPADDSSCPVAFVALPAVMGALIWLCVLLARLPQN
jgi:hypothetical protein